jgi:hypothetical protein
MPARRMRDLGSPNVPGNLRAFCGMLPLAPRRVDIPRTGGAMTQPITMQIFSDYV